MSTLPRIYCLTIPKSVRHKDATDQLNALGINYEFVYGKYWNVDEVPYAAIKGINTDRLYSDYPIRCWGCKKGHIDLLQKALADGYDYCISCEDDVWFEQCDWDKVASYCDKLDSLGGILNLGNDTMGYDFWFSLDDKRDDEFIYSHSWATDSCYLLNREGMQYYLNGLLYQDSESDTSMCKQLQQDNRIIPTCNRESTPIVLNPEFYIYSNIQS